LPCGGVGGYFGSISSASGSCPAAAAAVHASVAERLPERPGGSGSGYILLQ